MGWKNLHCWLKGGIIGIISYILWFLFFWIQYLIHKGEAGAEWALFPALAPGFILNGLVEYFTKSPGGGFNLVWYAIVTVALVGAFIGFIIGKIKGRKN